MPKVQVTFDHDNIRGTLEINMNETELAALQDVRDLEYLSAQNAIYLELHEGVAATFTYKQVHTLPTEEGVYMDTDGKLWRLSLGGVFTSLERASVQPTDFLPFTQLKLGRTY